jgi:polysaccharide export outer membrane protein
MRNTATILSVLVCLSVGGCASPGVRAPELVAGGDGLGAAAGVDAVDRVPAAGEDAMDSVLAALEDEAAATAGTEPEVGALSTDAVLRPGLTVSIRVSVAGRDEVSQTRLRISERGTLTLPLVGEVPVSGMTLVACTERLTTLYEEYLVDPQVAVQFEWTEGAISPWGTVTVLGRVTSPGKVPIPATRDLTVSAAIQQAGGFAPSARDNAITVSRANPDGTTLRIEVDLRALGRRGNLEEDIVLQSGDVVFVPEQIF